MALTPAEISKLQAQVASLKRQALLPPLINASATTKQAHARKIAALEKMLAPDYGMSLADLINQYNADPSKKNWSYIFDLLTAMRTNSALSVAAYRSTTDKNAARARLATLIADHPVAPGVVAGGRIHASKQPGLAEAAADADKRGYIVHSSGSWLSENWQLLALAAAVIAPTALAAGSASSGAAPAAAAVPASTPAAIAPAASGASSIGSTVASVGQSATGYASAITDAIAAGATPSEALAIGQGQVLADAIGAGIIPAGAVDTVSTAVSLAGTVKSISGAVKPKPIAPAVAPAVPAAPRAPVDTSQTVTAPPLLWAVVSGIVGFIFL